MAVTWHYAGVCFGLFFTFWRPEATADCQMSNFSTHFL
jgi:hypothetical protein